MNDDSLDALQNSKLLKPIFNPVHPHFTVHMPGLGPLKARPDILPKGLRATHSNHSVLSRNLFGSSGNSIVSSVQSSVASSPISIDITPDGYSVPKVVARRSSDTIQLKARLSTIEESNLRRKSDTATLRTRLAALQDNGHLQQAIVDSKKRLKDAKEAYSRFSDINHSPGKIAAHEECLLAERDVEDACKAWCLAARK
jgi:hypothetical protein